MTNIGAAAFTADAPATLTDDLSEVLDDATYNDDASNGAVYSAPELSWALALPTEQSITLTYSVTVDDPATGDLELLNAVTPGAGGECLSVGEGEDACTTFTPISSYAVAKTVSTTKTGPGDVVTYTISVSNTGLVDYTDEIPASFTDDLSKVLDDATYNADATNGATYAAPVLTWAGPLESGATITVTYSVTVNDPATGDRQLVNAVVAGDGGGCGTACATLTTVELPTPPLAITGLNPWIVGGGLGVGLLAIIGGLALLFVRRRNQIIE